MRAIFPATAARLAQWKEQPEVLGVLLVGSKSRGNDDDLSDDDLEVLLTDEAFALIQPKDCGEFHFEGEKERARLIYDAQYTSFTDLKRKRSSTHELDRWPYERARVLFDRQGAVAPIVAEVGSMNAGFRHMRLLYSTINTWIAAARAAKTYRRGFDAAGRLIVARGAKSLSRIIFALEWRWVPLDHWLEKELQSLKDEAQVGPLLVASLKSGNPALLQEALDTLEDRLAFEGVPRPAERHDLFYDLIHPTRAEDAAIHGEF
jgi:hypothetical protein